MFWVSMSHLSYYIQHKLQEFKVTASEMVKAKLNDSIRDKKL